MTPDPPTTCAACQSPDPVGGLSWIRRFDAAGVRMPDVRVCDLCVRTVAGQRLLAGAEAPELRVLVQCLNVIRKDVAQVLERLEGKR